MKRIMRVGLVLMVLVGLVACVREAPIPRAYQTKVYMTDGGDKMVVASGGEMEVQSGGTLDIQSGATTGYSGDVSLGDGITDNVYVYGQMRSYDGSDNWADITDVSALGRNNGWQASYNITGWGGDSDFQAGFFNTQVAVATADGTIYGVEGKSTLKGIVATGTTAGIGVMGKVIAKTTATWPEAYAVYGRLESDSGSDMITAGSAFMGDLDGLTADFGTVSVLSAESGDTWDYGVDLNPITAGTADIRLSNGETIANTTNDVVTVALESGTGHGVPGQTQDGEDLYVEDMFEVAGSAYFGNAITDNINVYGQMRSYDGSDNWADISDVSALDRGNGWHVSYNLTDGGSDQFQALFANTQVCTTTNTGSIYGVEAKATYKATEGSGPYAMAYGVFAKVTAKSSGGTHSTIPYAYPVYSILDVAASNVMAEAVNYFAENANSGTETNSYILKTHSSGDTWDYGIHLSDATINTAEIVGSNGETLKNTTDTAWQVGGFLGLEEGAVVDLAADATLTPAASYQPITTSEAGACTLNATTSIADGPVAGAILIICNEDAQNIVIKDGANTAIGGDVTLTGGAEDCITLLWNGADWVGLSFHDN